MLFLGTLAEKVSYAFALFKLVLVHHQLLGKGLCLLRTIDIQQSILQGLLDDEDAAAPPVNVDDGDDEAPVATQAKNGFAPFFQMLFVPFDYHPSSTLTENSIQRVRG